jgi:hypothetical protein
MCVKHGWARELHITCLWDMKMSLQNVLANEPIYGDREMFFLAIRSPSIKMDYKNKLIIRMGKTDKKCKN